jgi:hypothetical protein
MSLMQPRISAATTAIVIYFFTVICFVSLGVPTIVSNILLQNNGSTWMTVYSTFCDAANAGLAPNGYLMMEAFRASASFLMTLLLQRKVNALTAVMAVVTSSVLIISVGCVDNYNCDRSHLTKLPRQSM